MTTEDELLEYNAQRFFEYAMPSRISEWVDRSEDFKNTFREALVQGEFPPEFKLAKFIPKPLPQSVGTIIAWYADNDAGKDILNFAERIVPVPSSSEYYGMNTWRVNGFDLYPDTFITINLRNHDWFELVRKTDEEEPNDA